MKCQVADIPKAGLRSASTALLLKSDGLDDMFPALIGKPCRPKNVGKGVSTHVDEDCVFCCTTEPGEMCQTCGLPVPLKKVEGL
jgi:hypothetical protein